MRTMQTRIAVATGVPHPDAVFEGVHLGLPTLSAEAQTGIQITWRLEVDTRSTTETCSAMAEQVLLNKYSAKPSSHTEKL
jgi:hypothetical protein